MSSNTVNDKTGKPINIGDTVSTRIRGGKRTGEVEDVLLDQADADLYNNEGNLIKIQNPPKVVFEDQHGHTVSHNPETLTHGEVPKK
ncbi:hypothetical protein PENSPDRAFT_236748 [Peniophora sp. CONT]|nr:hypothetical protein PENSPDRAFT_236748 [Peniophora sp. CONT]